MTRSAAETTPAWDAVLHAGLEQLGLAGHDGVGLLLAYTCELERWNERLGLVHASGAELIIRHVLDSLSGLAIIRSLAETSDAPVIADIGTGGGLPGIPLACFLPHTEIHLVERSERKCGFLRGALLAAGLRNVRVVNRDLRELHRRFDLIVFRAFRPLSGPFVSRLMRLLRPGGAVCAYKGRAERVGTEIASLGDDLAAQLEIEIAPVAVPFLSEERHMVTLKRHLGDTATLSGGS